MMQNRQVIVLLFWVFVLLVADNIRLEAQPLPPIEIKFFSLTGNTEQHPHAEINVDKGYKIIGGGARVNWSGAGNLLTSSYPKNNQTWFASSKDHAIVSPANITVWAIAIHDPQNKWWDVRIFSNRGSNTQHPTSIKVIPSDYILTGGGAHVNWSGAGNLLTASYPKSHHSWEARSKDHTIVSPADITTYAIGIKAKNNSPLLEMRIFSNISKAAPHPLTHVKIDDGFTLTGGGAFVHWTRAGNLLTASYPQTSRSWAARSKDHIIPDPAQITVYAIGIKARR